MKLSERISSGDISQEVVEAVAQAIDRSLSFDVESSVRVGETTHEERMKIAQAAITALLRALGE